MRDGVRAQVGRGRRGQVPRSDAAPLLPPQEVMKHLTQAELTDLIWTAVEGLGSTSPFRVQAAASMLLTAVQEHGAKLETVRAAETRRDRGVARSRTQGLGPLDQGGALSLSLSGETRPHPNRLRGGRRLWCAGPSGVCRASSRQVLSER